MFGRWAEERRRHEAALDLIIANLVRINEDQMRTGERLDDLGVGFRELNQRIARGTRHMVEEFAEIREQNRVHRQSLLALIDRIDGWEQRGTSSA